MKIEFCGKGVRWKRSELTFLASHGQVFLVCNKCGLRIVLSYKKYPKFLSEALERIKEENYQKGAEDAHQ